MRWLAQWLWRLVAACDIIIGCCAFAFGIAVVGLAGAPAALAFVFCFWLLPTFVHECGHAIAATAAGWRVWIFRVAPLTVRLRPLGLSLDPTAAAPDAAGLVIATPLGPKQDTWSGSAWYCAGGPIASWLLAAFGALLAAPSLIANEQIDPWQGAAAAIAARALGQALTTTWPFIPSTERWNDASLLRRALKSRRNFVVTNAPAATAHHLLENDIPESALDGWMREGLAAERAVNAAFPKVLEALHSDDEQNAKLAIAEFCLAHPASQHARILQGFNAAWFEGDVGKADMALCKGASIPGSDLFRLRQAALAMIFRLVGEADAAQRTAATIGAQNATAANPPHPSWRALGERAMSRPMPPPQDADAGKPKSGQ